MKNENGSGTLGLKSQRYSNQKLSHQYQHPNKNEVTMDPRYSDLRSETKGFRFESGCQLCAEVSSLQ